MKKTTQTNSLRGLDGLGIFRHCSLWIKRLAILTLAFGAGLAANAQFNFNNFTNMNVALPEGNVPSCVRLADFNQDNILDLVVAHDIPGGTNIVVYLGVGDGTFRSPTNFATGGRAFFVAAGDMTGDGWTDILTVNKEGESVSFLIGFGDGDFVQHQDYLLPGGSQPSSLVIADFNFDGTNDFAVTLYALNQVVIFMGQDDNTFIQAGTYAVGNGPVAIVKGDFNLDGKRDLAVLNKTDNTISVLLGYGNGQFAVAQTSTVGIGSNPGSLAVADCNRDNYPDLVITTTSPDRLVGLTNNFFGFFSPMFNYAISGPGAVAVADYNRSGVKADFNQDKTNDVVIALPGGNQVQVRAGVAPSGFSPGQLFTADNNPVFVDIGDLNGDTVPDFVVANQTAGTVSVLLNHTPVAFAQTVSVNEDGSTNIVLRCTTNTALNFNLVAPGHGTLSSLTSSNITYTPGLDYFGADSFTYTVTDGSITSVPAQVSINVLPVNDKPSFDVVTTSVSVPEDVGFYQTNLAFNMSKGPANENGQTYQFILSTDTPSLFSSQPSMTPAGRLSFKPALNSNGVANVTITMKDSGGTLRGGIDSAVTNITITVTAVNDAPSFKRGTNVTVVENCGLVTISNWATNISPGPANEAWQTVSFVATNTNPTLFSVQPAVSPTGTLTFTPAQDSNGTAIVYLQLQDNGGTPGVSNSITQSFIISVRAKNNQPYFEINNLLANQQVYEDAITTVVSNFVNVISTGPANETNSQSYTFFCAITGGDTDMFSVKPYISRDGTLTYKPKANSNGTATITVTMRDSGGTLYGGINTISTNFNINVLPVNDRPTFTIPVNLATFVEDQGAVTVNNFISNIKAGPPNEADQTVTFHVTTDNPSLFIVAPAIDSNGTLTFTTAPNTSGEAMLFIIATDDGPTGGLGDNNTSLESRARVVVYEVNDAPSLTLVTNTISVPINMQSYSANIVAAMSAGANEGNQVLTLRLTGNSNPGLFGSLPTLTSSGVLSFKPGATTGSATLTITVYDNGGTARGGINSFTTNLVINITPP